MKIIKWHVNTGFAGCTYEGEIEVDDDATDTEIDEMVREEMFNVMNWGWIVRE